jgi:methyl-accepting chemotaxis protein
MLNQSVDKTTFVEMTQANNQFSKSWKALVKARDSGVSADIERVYKEQFAPASQVLLENLTQLRAANGRKISQSVTRINDLSMMARWSLIAFGIGALLLGGGLSLRLAKGISHPIRQAVNAANQVAALDLTAHIEGHNRDEAGHLLAALASMQVALRLLVSEVQGTSQGVAEGAHEIAAGNLDLSNRTELAAAFLQQTAAAVEEIATTMHQALDAASRGNVLAKAASLKAQEGSIIMSEVTQTMRTISESARQIVDITAVIDGIAFQTNILALNAAVEAARAGEQGRGFAVVATEVRTLANRSAAAARQIKGLIHNSVEQVVLGSRKADQAQNAMMAVVDTFGSVTQVIGEIVDGTRHQNSSIASISVAVNKMDAMTQQNAALIEESAAAARQLSDQAGNLRDVAARFRLPLAPVALLQAA